MSKNKPWQICPLLFLLGIIGCQDSPVRVSGQVTLDGQSFNPVEGQMMKVILQPIDLATSTELSPEQKAALIASVTKSGEFIFSAVPSGTYTVTAADFDRFPSADRLAAHFRQAPSDIVWDISDDSPQQTLALDRTWFQESKRRR